MDNGGEFISKEINDVCFFIYIRHSLIKIIIKKLITNKMGSLIVHGRPRHPQSQGVVERVNQTLKKMLFNFQSDWSNHLQEITLNYNNTRHSTTGFPPVQAETGIRPTLDKLTQKDYVIDREIINEKIKIRIEKAGKKMKQYYDSKNSNQIEVFSEGEVVLVSKPPFSSKKKNSNVFQYEGIIEKVKDDYTFDVKLLSNGYLQSHKPGTVITLPIIQLKKCFAKYNEKNDETSLMTLDDPFPFSITGIFCDYDSNDSDYSSVERGKQVQENNSQNNNNNNNNNNNKENNNATLNNNFNNNNKNNKNKTIKVNKVNKTNKEKRSNDIIILTNERPQRKRSTPVHFDDFVMNNKRIKIYSPFFFDQIIVYCNQYLNEK